MKQLSTIPQHKTLEESLKELKRELDTRIRVYPDWISWGKVSFDVAQHRNDELRVLIDRLEKEIARTSGTQQSLF